MNTKHVARGLVAGLAATLTFALAPAAARATTPTGDSASSAAHAAYAESPLQQRAAELLAQSDLSPELQARALDVVAQLPADWEQRVAAKKQQFGLTRTTWFEQSQSAIDPGDYQCANTPLQEWLSQQIRGVNGFRMLFLMLLGGDQIPTYDALLFGSEGRDNSFGIDGSYTNELTREMNSLRRFWDIDGSDIQLVPMHGDVYQDINRITRVLEVLYGLSHEDAAGDAEIIQAIVLDEPILDDGENPYFTFNAFAFDPTPEEAAQYGLTKRIIMGDGILQGLRGIGLGDKAAPLGVLAHEYGHHVQYAKDLIESPLPAPEATRRTELMADAFGTYFVVHARGTALNAHRTLDVQESFYNSGDCNFAGDGHHGTPNQRLKSSEFAVSVIDGSPDQGHKLPALAFEARFEEALPGIVAPDAG
jgi:hypothetical protein